MSRVTELVSLSFLTLSVVFWFVGATAGEFGRRHLETIAFRLMVGSWIAFVSLWFVWIWHAVLTETIR